MPDPAGALVWPATGTFVVSDPHLQKGWSFARIGMLLPPWDTRATLDRLTLLLRRCHSLIIVALSDSFHHRYNAQRLRATGGAGVMRVCVLILAAWTAGSATARAETPAAFCARVGTDDTLRPIPAALAPAVNAAFHTAMPTDVATRMTVFRCADRRVLVCSVGANLPCGKADTSRANVGAAQWCKDHRDAPFIPAAETGHATIFDWRCRNGRPVTTEQRFRVDRRGFIAEFWRALAP